MCLKALLLDSTTIEKHLCFKTECINLVNEIGALHSSILRLACIAVLPDVYIQYFLYGKYMICIIQCCNLICAL